MKLCTLNILLQNFHFHFLPQILHLLEVLYLKYSKVFLLNLRVFA